MTLYVDTSALLKRYIDEDDSDTAETHLASDPVLVTSRLTEVEVRRNLARLLDGDQLSDAKRQLAQDLDADTCTRASHIAETTLCRSLDALHLAAAWRAGQNTTVLTFDLRRAATARSLGLAVLGA